MEPVVLVCDGCRARIRTPRPETTRGRDCPRCGRPLALATLDRPAPVPEIPPASPPPSARLRPAAINKPAPRGLTGGVAALALLAAVHSILHQLGALEATVSASPPSFPRRTPSRALSVTLPAPEFEDGVERVPADPPALEADEEDAPGAFSMLEDRPVPRIGGPDSPKGLRPPPGPDDPEPEAIDAAPTLQVEDRPPGGEPVPIERPERMLVQDREGRTVVTRVHGRKDGRPLVLLPDGQLGIPDRIVPTSEPFVPATRAEMLHSLRDRPGAPFADFSLRETPHYLVFYQSTDSFAEASAKLLENLLADLSERLGRWSIPVREPAFPLVAVIFRSEDEFRRFKPVAAEVQAYYEIFSNRIYFYQASDRDQDAPEVSALRKPQTVAHEGAHQILHNIGVQPRLAPWPLWLIEGLAEYCSPPTVNRKGLVDWAGIGQVNPIHMATIRDLADQPARPVLANAGPRVGRDPKTPTVEYLVSAPRLTPTDYALSWALTHYLATRRPDEFGAYLRLLSQLRPMQTVGPEDQLAVFRGAFGDNLRKMDQQIVAHLSRLKGQDALPFYAVVFEQPLPGGLTRRAAMVSQSPSVIREWLETVASPSGGPSQWQAQRYPSRVRALQSIEGWLRPR